MRWLLFVVIVFIKTRADVWLGGFFFSSYFSDGQKVEVGDGAYSNLPCDVASAKLGESMCGQKPPETGKLITIHLYNTSSSSTVFVPELDELPKGHSLDMST